MKKIKKLVVATRNKAKAQEWDMLLKLFLPTVNVVSLSEFDDVSDPEETGKTFQENADLKASYYAKKIGEFAFADDGGYEITALGGAPGVRSRRIKPDGSEGTDEEIIEWVLSSLTASGSNDRSASLTSAISLSDPDGNIIYRDIASFKGMILEKPGPIMMEGYPFRSIHYIPELGKTYAEMTHEEHEKHSHKRKMGKKMADFLKNI